MLPPRGARFSRKLREGAPLEGQVPLGKGKLRGGHRGGDDKSPVRRAGAGCTGHGRSCSRVKRGEEKSERERSDVVSSFTRKPASQLRDHVFEQFQVKCLK